jgi:hypothetical protein
VGPLLVNKHILSYCNDFLPCEHSIGNRHTCVYYLTVMICNKHSLSYCNDFFPCGSSIGNKHILSYCNDFPLVGPLLVINIYYLAVMIFPLWVLYW